MRAKFCWSGWPKPNGEASTVMSGTITTMATPVQILTAAQRLSAVAFLRSRLARLVSAFRVST
jgi:hypothetical protein